MTASRDFDQIDYPKTADEWWLVCEHYKNELVDYITYFHPFYKNNINMPITAPLAERMCVAVRQSINRDNKYDDQSPHLLFLAYLHDKNSELANILNETWFGIPESVTAHSLPHFGILCDLCSESYVLFDGEDEKDEE